MEIKDDQTLGWSPIVANNRMNRERVAIGVNSYEQDLKLNIIEYIESNNKQGNFRWMDLCCGKANALIQVSKHFTQKKQIPKIYFEGIDLVNFFNPQYKKYDDILRITQMNLSNWNPAEQYDLITIVHGLHYVGNKLELIIKASNALKTDGLFIGNLDLQNIKLLGNSNQQSALKKYFKEEAIVYDAKSKLLSVQGNKVVNSRFKYVGSNDKAGPNYTGQNAVDSIYK